MRVIDLDGDGDLFIIKGRQGLGELLKGAMLMRAHGVLSLGCVDEHDT